MSSDPASMPPPHPATILVAPPAAVRTMHAPHERPPLAPDARTDTAWIWALVITPWVLASTIFLFDIKAVLDALWVNDSSGALGHVFLHVGVLAGSSLLTIGLALFYASRDARHLRRIGVVRPFPWGWAAVAGIVYLLGRTIVLKQVTRPPLTPLIVSAVLYLLYYAAFGVWAVATLSSALNSLGTAG